MGAGPDSLASVLLTACKGDVEGVDRRQLESTLGSILVAAREAWPDIELDTAEFVRSLGERVGLPSRRTRISNQRHQ